MERSKENGSFRGILIAFAAGILLTTALTPHIQAALAHDPNKRPEIRVEATLSPTTCQASFSSATKAELARFLPFSDKALVTAKLPDLDCVTSLKDVERILSDVDRELGAAGLSNYTVALEFYPDGASFEFSAWNGGVISNFVSRYTFEPKSQRGA